MVITQDEFLEQLQEIDAYEFEQFVAKIWELQNWDTYVTKGADDGGIDVVTKQSTPFPKKQVIQVKRYAPSNSVGRPDIQQYASIRQEQTDVDMVVVVTTGQFTDGAEEAAKKLNVKLIDGPRLYNLIDALDAFQLVQSYIEPEANRDGTTSTEPETGTTDTPTQKRDALEGSQSIIQFDEGTQLNDIPTLLPSLIKFRENIANNLETLQSKVDSADKAFQEERYFDAVEQYEEINKRRTELRRKIARYDAGLTHTDNNTIEHLPSTETFTTNLSQITEHVNEHFQEAFQIAERAKGLELLVAEICKRVDSIKDRLKRGDKMRQSADVGEAYSEYEQAEYDLEEVRKTMDIYHGLVSTYADAIIESHDELPQEIALSEFETKITSRIDSKGELLDRQNAAENAAGSFSASLLTDNSGELFDKDLIEYLAEDQQIEFVFEPPRKGFKIISSEGTEEAPPYDALQPGSSFLVITDQRILHIAGVDDHDETMSIEYDQLTDIEASPETTSPSLQIICADGTKYEFAGLGSHASDLEPAASYVGNQI